MKKLLPSIGVLLLLGLNVVDAGEQKVVEPSQRGANTFSFNATTEEQFFRSLMNFLARHPEKEIASIVEYNVMFVDTAGCSTTVSVPPIPKQNTTPPPIPVQVGIASWYGEKFHGRHTATGDVFNQNGMTAASPSLPLNSPARVTNLENGRAVIVWINDRGPYTNGRVLDVSMKAAKVLGFKDDGTAQVKIEPIF